ncbi:MAG: hypothetical protein KDA96_27690, partial [Planctomycetaceae bacterium]|nr:hypothetical protein [Planctomycetaceae bacterium]
QLAATPLQRTMAAIETAAPQSEFLSAWNTVWADLRNRQISTVPVGSPAVQLEIRNAIKTLAYHLHPLLEVRSSPSDHA